MFKIDPNISIFIQLANFIRYEIYSGKRKPGDKIESIRDMAIIFEVNPNTIRRVYQDLEDEGLIYTDSTLGKFIILDEIFILKKKYLFIQNELEKFLLIAIQCGIDKNEINKMLEGVKYESNNWRYYN